MASLDCRIPELANPYFVDMFERCRCETDRTALNIIDLGASYGVDAALLKWDLTLEQLFGRYTDPDSRSVGPLELLNKDRAFVRVTAFMQYRSPLGLGPSGKTCSRWAPRVLLVIILPRRLGQTA